MFSKDKVENELLGGSRVKLQKGREKLNDGGEADFYKRLMVYESRWRLLVFWVPHTHWRRLCDKVEEILEDSAVCTDMHRLRLSAAVDSCRQKARRVDRRSIASQ